MSATRQAPVTEVTDPQRWNALVDTMEGGFFTQLWEWGELRRTIGWEPHRLVWGEGDAAAQLAVRRIPVARWGIAHAPRGPLGARTPDAAARLAADLASWGRDRRIATVVVDPDVLPGAPLSEAIEREPWRHAAPLGENRVHVLDFVDGTDPWAGIRKKHREWIRRAEKADLDVSWADADTPDAKADEAMTRFEHVYGELVERLHLATHGPAFTRRLWTSFRDSRRAQLVTASLHGEPVAAMLHVTWGDVMLWYAGAQAEAGAPVGAGKLLLWRSIQRAQELGFRRYHMWGTATDSLAHYKEGFGAREIRYVGTRALDLDRLGARVVDGVWAGQRRVVGWRHSGGPVRRLRKLRPRRSPAA